MQSDERTLANLLKCYAVRIHAPDVVRWQLLLAATAVHRTCMAPEYPNFHCPNRWLPDDQIYSFYAEMTGWRRIL